MNPSREILRDTSSQKPSIDEISRENTISIIKAKQQQFITKYPNCRNYFVKAIDDKAYKSDILSVTSHDISAKQNNEYKGFIYSLKDFFGVEYKPCPDNIKYYNMKAMFGNSEVYYVGAGPSVNMKY